MSLLRLPLLASAVLCRRHASDDDMSANLLFSLLSRADFVLRAMCVRRNWSVDSGGLLSVFGCLAFTTYTLKAYWARACLYTRCPAILQNAAN